ncbi:class I SAM-dependent methyltransferase [Ktedonosporobacter rubrisoli]|uniref:Class I SAM-dependent methyltransferase n=1 Tax=Ktedonosporobacter rubrisoli TaxID=2509675 RepID=A0A4P6JMJ5_KTERU|nr:class I SAM-dependent methyltransferase [Ktedonosporobacter rubrisoli]QBD76242.1 class I SAM-dependent methyltransferase [Ktedonosporobacter rubrisoli]
MLQIKQTLEAALNRQYPCPKGIPGRLIGELMVRQHKIETHWSVSLADVQSTDCVLELGFGAGKAIELLAARARQGQVYGLDISPTMVKRASERNSRAIRAGRVILRQGDIAQLPFADCQFDTIVSIHTFYFWSDPQAVFTEILRVLKPGGKLICILATGKMGESDYYQSIVDTQTLPLMRSLGFTDVSTCQGPLSRQFKILAMLGSRPVAS